MLRATRRLLSATIATAIVLAGGALLPPTASAGVGATLHGQVLGEDGRVPSTHTRVELQRYVNGGWTPLGGDSGSAYTDWGSYRITGIPAGTYRVEFEQLDHLVHHESVTLTDGDERRLDVVLDRGAAITGKVHVPAGAPGLTAFVKIFARMPLATGPSAWQQVDYAYVEPSGVYSVSGFGAGTYRVGVFPTGGPFPVEYYDNAADLQGAVDLPVAADGTVSGIDFDLGTAPVAAPPPTKPSVTFGPRARLDGKPEVGRVLKVRGLRVRPRTATVTYRWFVGDTRLRRSVLPHQRLKPPMAGRRVTVRVVARVPGHTKAKTVLRARTRVQRPEGHRPR